MSERADTQKARYERDMADTRRGRTISPDEWEEYMALRELAPELLHFLKAVQGLVGETNWPELDAVMTRAKEILGDD